MPGTRRLFDAIASDLAGPSHPLSLKGNSYILTCMCLLTNYPIAIPIPNKQAETSSKNNLKIYMLHLVGP